MESFFTESLSDALYHLTPNYDTERQSFVSSSEGGTTEYVRHVENKRIPASHPPNVKGGGSHSIVRDTINQEENEPLYDEFTGIIDGITGELLSGKRRYVLTGEIYEGSFRHGLRHGEAVVQNVYLPSGFRQSHNHVIHSISYQLSRDDSDHEQHEVRNTCPRFYGTYRNDAPYEGTLVIPSIYSYHGRFLHSRPHGNGTLIRPNGYKYEGEFKNGSYDGYGTEIEARADTGVKSTYDGEFVAGEKQGHGVLTVKRPSIESELSSTTQTYSYNGQWIRNQRQGNGEELDFEGKFYKGQFHANERHGFGTLKFPLHLQLQFSYNDPNNSSNCNNDIKNQTNDDSRILISAEGLWRAGVPVDGTHSWFLVYKNGDSYTGHASNFIPNGCGMMRYANKDIYTGEWKNFQRHGDGIFISSLRGDEYSGRWENDKMKPMEESIKTIEKRHLIDLHQELLHCSSNMSLKEFKSNNPDSTDDEHESPITLFEKIMKQSLLSSLNILDQENDHNKVTSPKAAGTIVPKTTTSIALQNDACSNEKKSTSRAQLQTYPNGDTYLGDTCPKTNRRNGYGVYISCATGTTYSGYFVNDLRQGSGILVHPLGKYSGEFHNDKKNGVGTLVLNDSSSYNGQFREGQFHGRGTVCEKDGTVYVGDWVNGLRHGDGFEVLADGRVYSGEYRDGKRHGVGTMLEKSGGKVTYSGFWFEGLYHGEGVSIHRLTANSTNADIIYDNPKSTETHPTLQYDGSFRYGKWHGFGTFTNSMNNIMCKGMWNMGRPVTGKWRIRFQDGAIYTGEAKGDIDESVIEETTSSSSTTIVADGKLAIPVPDGFGTMKYGNGDVFIGAFSDGKRSRGKCVFINGDQWDGDWVDDNPCTGGT